jgi:hypothetical protein
MDLRSPIVDNVSDVLLRIVRFTQLRRVILNRNICGIDVPGYVPRDLPVVEFAGVLDNAIAEHRRHHRLLFRDTANIKFGAGGTLRVRPLTDEYARTLLRANRDEYLALQINRLLEDWLNQKVAEELIQEDSRPMCRPFGVDLDDMVAVEASSEDAPPRTNSMD